MKKAKSTMKKPTEKELDAHVQKAMRAARTRMQINSAQLIADALRDAWTEADKTRAQKQVRRKRSRVLTRPVGESS